MAMRLILSAAGLALLTVQPAMAAEVVDSSAHVIRLSPEQKAAAMADGSEQKVDAALAQATGGGNDDGIDYGDRVDRRIHGEVGFMIGTNGARGMYGTAAIPLGDNAGAVVSFSNERYNLPRSYRRR